MTIAVLSTAHREGTGAYEALDHFLRGYGGARNELTIISPRDSLAYDTAVELGVPAIDLGTVRDAMVSNFVGLFKAVPQLAQCDAVHAWHSRGFELALWLGRKLRVPSFGTMHDHPACSTHRVARRLLMRYAARRLTRVVCVSRALERAWEQAGVQGRTTVIRNGLRDVAPDPASHAAPIVGFLGMYSPWKGFGTVGDWIERSSESCPMKWNLYGTVARQWRKSAERLANRYPNRVELRGRQAPAQIFSEISVLVHASTEFDPLPTVLIEAARAGIPVVASRVGGVEEIVEHGISGYLFDPAAPDEGLQHLMRLVADNALRKRMGQAGRCIFEKSFTVGTMVSAYRAFWRSHASGTLCE